MRLQAAKDRATTDGRNSDFEYSKSQTLPFLLALVLAAFSLGQATCFADTNGWWVLWLLGAWFALLWVLWRASSLRPGAPPGDLTTSTELSASSEPISIETSARDWFPLLSRTARWHPALLITLLCLVLWQAVIAFLALQSLLVQMHRPGDIWVWGAVAVVAGIVWSLRSWRGWWLQLALLGGFMLPSLLQRAPDFDVFILQRDSCAALLRGVNPYAITFPSLYPDNSPYYGAGLSVGGRLQFGYVYPPLSLLLDLPGYLLGDVRWAHGVALLVALLLLTGTKPRGEKALLGALFAWTPFMPMMLYLSWTDTWSALTLCLILFCIRRRLSWLPIACGLFLVSKQYALLVAPLLWLLVPLHDVSSTRFESTRVATPEREVVLTASHNARHFWKMTLASASVVLLPFVLWNPAAFFHSVVGALWKLPFRPDSVSISAWINARGWGQLPAWTAFLLTLAALLFCLKRAPRNEIGFFVSTAFVLLTFFLFNKQSFANYYYFVICAICCAAMALSNRLDNAAGRVD